MDDRDENELRFCGPTINFDENKNRGIVIDKYQDYEETYQIDQNFVSSLTRILSLEQERSVYNITNNDMIPIDGHFPETHHSKN